MSVSRLSKDRWRAQIHVAGRGNVDVSKITPDLYPTSIFATKREAKDACHEARKRVTQTEQEGVTVREFRDRWLTDPLFHDAWKEGADGPTAKHNAERTKAFADTYGNVPIRKINRETVSKWLAGGNRKGTVPALRAMFNAAATVEAGELVDGNPFAGVQKRRRKPAQQRPPGMAEIDLLVKRAKELTPPSYAAFLEFACLTGARPGEIDALRPDRVDFDRNEVDIVEQWNVKVGRFTTPKYGAYTLSLVARARRVLMDMKVQEGAGEFVFMTTRGTHYTPSSRTHHWNRVRSGVGMGDVRFYDATRHAFASYALNVLGLPPHIIAEQLGHKDGGKLVVSTYGHPDAAVARERIRRAFDDAENVVQLPDRKQESA